MTLCKHFGSCGGCRTQHLSYEAQLIEKQALVESLFPFPVQPILPCSHTLRYRHKMEFTFFKDRLGLFGKKCGVVDLEECLISPLWFEEVLQRTRHWWRSTSLKAYYPPRNLGSLRTLTLRGDKMIILTVSGEEAFALSEEEISSFQKSMPEDASVYLLIQRLKKGHPTEWISRHLAGPKALSLTLLGLYFEIQPQAFFQPHVEQAALLYSKALEISCLDKNMTVFDLYAGTGTLSLLAAKQAGRVISIELHPESVASARRNALLNQVHNLEILEGDVGRVLETLNIPADLAIVDPPRSGLDQAALQHILRLAPQKLLYISCNPATQAANLSSLLEAYEVAVVQPIDQFPHTPHVENIVLLKKR